MDDYKYTTVLGMGELSTALHLIHQIHCICQKCGRCHGIYQWNNTTRRM